MPKTINGVKFFDRADLADLFRCSVSTINRWVRNGSFPNGARLYGGKVLWSEQVIEKYLSARQAGLEEINLCVFRALQPEREKALLKIEKHKTTIARTVA